MREPLEYVAILLAIFSYYAFFMGLHYSTMFSSLPFLIMRIILAASIVLLSIMITMKKLGGRSE